MSRASTLQSGKAADGQGFLGTGWSIFRGRVTQLPLKFIFPEGEQISAARTRKHEGVSVAGERESSEPTPRARTRGLFEADEEIWRVTDENREEEKERQGNMDHTGNKFFCDIYTS